MKKLYLFGLACMALGLSLTGCQAKHHDEIKLSFIGGPSEEQTLLVAQKVAKQRYGLNVKLVSFSDYSLPNEALASGDIATPTCSNTSLI